MKSLRSISRVRVRGVWFCEYRTARVRTVWCVRRLEGLRRSEVNTIRCVSRDYRSLSSSSAPPPRSPQLQHNHLDCVLSTPYSARCCRSDCLSPATHLQDPDHLRRFCVCRRTHRNFPCPFDIVNTMQARSAPNAALPITFVAQTSARCCASSPPAILFPLMLARRMRRPVLIVHIVRRQRCRRCQVSAARSPSLRVTSPPPLITFLQRPTKTTLAFHPRPQAQIWGLATGGTSIFARSPVAPTGKHLDGIQDARYAKHRGFTGRVVGRRRSARPPFPDAPSAASPFPADCPPLAKANCSGACRPR